MTSKNNASKMPTKPSLDGIEEIWCNQWEKNGIYSFDRNKTREEIARDYVSKREMEQDLARILNAIERLDEKLDRIQEAAAKEFRL